MPSELSTLSVLLNPLISLSWVTKTSCFPYINNSISIKQKSDENKEKYHLGDYLNWSNNKFFELAS